MKKTIQTISEKTARSFALALALINLPPALALTPGNLPSDVSTAPAIPINALRALSWMPLIPPVTHTEPLTAHSQTLPLGDIEGAVGAYALPADRGSLEITLASRVEKNNVYPPSVLVLDEQRRASAFYPSRYFSYQQPGAMGVDRLEGTLKLTPALGQKHIYLLVFAAKRDLLNSTKMVAPAKAYAAGVGNAIPAIPDPVAAHRPNGTLTIKVKAEQNTGNVMIGAMTPEAPPAAARGQTPATATGGAFAQPSAPMLEETDHYFNHSIRNAVSRGDIDNALTLMNEAEKLGSTTARDTFIRSVKGEN